MTVQLIVIVIFKYRYENNCEIRNEKCGEYTKKKNLRIVLMNLFLN